MLLLFVAVPLLFSKSNLIARLIGPPVEAVLGWATAFLNVLV